MRYLIAAFAAVMVVAGTSPAIAQSETWSSFVKTAPALALPYQSTDVFPVIRGVATYTVPATTALGSSVIDITQYGAVCDGTTDDSAALIAADATVGIGTLAVLKTCRLSNNVTLAHSLYIGKQGALSVDVAKTLTLSSVTSDNTAPFPGAGTIVFPGSLPVTSGTGLATSGMLKAAKGIGVTNDFNPVGSTGINPGFRVMIGANQSATPGVNDAVAGTVYIDNLNGRGASGGLWALDLLTLQANGGNDSISHSIEVEVNNLGAAPTDPFSNIQGARKNGIELVAHNSSTANPTSALWVWGASATTSTWWNVGLAMSRVHLDGIVFENYAADTAAFSDAAIWDNSASSRVLKVSGAHNNIFDFQGETQLGTGDTFIHLPQTYDTNLLIKNFSDHVAKVTLDSGAGAPQNTYMQFADNGTVWWDAGKNNGNSYTVFNVQTSKTDIQVTTGDIMTLGPGTAAGVVQIATGSPFKRATTTVASLPACAGGTTYYEFTVTDGNAPTYGATITGLGAIPTPVICDGTNWKAH